MEGLDPFFKDLATTDTKKKIAHGETIIKENIINGQFVILTCMQVVGRQVFISQLNCLSEFLYYLISILKQSFLEDI